MFRTDRDTSRVYGLAIQSMTRSITWVVCRRRSCQGGTVNNYNAPPQYSGAPQPPHGYPPQQHGFYPEQQSAFHQPQVQAPLVNPRASQLDPQIDKGWFAALFDLSFDTFVAIKVVKVLFIFFLLFLILMVSAGMLAGVFALTENFALAIMIWITTPILGLFYLIFGRVSFEVLVVIFKIAEDLDDIAKHTKAS